MEALIPFPSVYYGTYYTQKGSNRKKQVWFLSLQPLNLFPDSPIIMWSNWDGKVATPRNWGR